MRVAIDARACSDHFPGIARYIAGLLQGLAELGTAGAQIAVLYDPGASSTRFDLVALAQAGGLELVPVRAGPFSLRQQLLLPLVLRHLRVELYHATYYLRPYGPLPCPAITTIHDLIPQRFPQYYPQERRLVIQLATRLALARSQRLIAVSHSTQEDLWAYYRVPHDDVSVTPLAVDARFRRQPPQVVEELRQRLQLPQRYLLYLGSNKPHKNLPRLLRAWHVVRERPVAQGIVLVVAGPWDARYPEAREVAARLQLGADKLRWLGPVAEQDLPALYSGALAFVFPSMYEGFGLPVLEAMACEVPVVTSYTSAMREVADNTGILVDPTNYHEIAEGMLQALRAQASGSHTAALGRKHAEDFSWERMAALTLRAYRRTLL